jgi:hypothetical protein
MDITRFEATGHYRIACDCQDNEHDSLIYFDLDEVEKYPHPALYLGHELTATYYDHYYDKWWQKLAKHIWFRIRTATRVLFIGKVAMWHDFCLNSDNVAAFKEVLEKYESSLRKIPEELGTGSN